MTFVVTRPLRWAGSPMMNFRASRPSTRWSAGRAYGISALVASALLGACDREAEDAGAIRPRDADCHLPAADLPTAAWDEAAFTDHFTRVSTISLSSVGDSGFASARAIDLSRPGSYLIVDSRNRNIKIIDTTGVVQRVIGREGLGPGEFRAPYDARYLPSGEIVALDPEVERVSFFDTTGTFTGSFTPSGQDPRRILPDGPDGILIAGLADARSGDWVLVRYDRKGKRLGTLVKADPLLFAIDLIVSQPWLVRAPDGSTLVGVIPTPAVHRVSADGAQDCVALAPKAWQQLRPRDKKDGGSLASMRKWIESASLVDGAAVLADGRLALIYSVPGPVEARRLVLYSPDLAPLADLTGVPGYLAGSLGDDLVFVKTEEATGITLERYRAKARGTTTTAQLVRR